MSGAFVIFVKTPQISPVKTRLAATLGQEVAETFHLKAAHALSGIAADLSQQADMQGYYAVAEQDALEHPYWQDLPCVWQGDGGLGERMRTIYQTLLQKHDFVILVGADIPQMTVAELLKAVHWLSNQAQDKFAFAPSEDGGFWLFAGNALIPSESWTDVSYSQPDTGTQFLNKIQPLGACKILHSLRDVDEQEDLWALQNSLRQLPVCLPEQQALLHFLEAVLIKEGD